MKINRKKIFQLVKNIVFLFGLFLIVICLNNIFVRKDSSARYKTFFNDRNQFDVVFFGTSHTMYGVYPMELWNDYGIASYNLGAQGNSLATTYWILVNTMDYVKPDLVVLDVSRIELDQKISSIPFQHISMDRYPLTLNKVRAMYDLFDDKTVEDKNHIVCYERRWNFLFPFLAYHTRWSELKENDFREGVSVEKGATFNVNVAVPQKYKLIPEEQVMENETLGQEYVCKAIEFCQSNDIDILLTYLPFPASESKQEGGNTARLIAEKYGVDYINFVQMDSVVDYETDMHDKASHLNPSGGRKVTEYLGEYISKNYDIPDRREDQKYQSWYDAYDAYVSYKIAWLNQEDITLENYLMLLSDKGFDCCIYIKDDSKILKDERIVKLIQNISSLDEFVKLQSAAENQKEYFTFVDNGSKNIWEYEDDEETHEIETSVGTIKFGHTVYENRCLNIDGDSYNYLDYWTQQEAVENTRENMDAAQPDMSVIVFERGSGEIVSSSNWYYLGESNIVRQ